ncbi:hypothetical protein [Bdellovibrio svalbardensis]|uniref:Uncharacterized protein n=1 Tax=Bdellovibrio svalbardensis TaxID=2972972 RepID=A0ABT6DG43_9BACT|nr:hypothetical protein [Bdellovibrio svalbardensis]MDG0815773.1 hypothetical protein [Bdellovibrio svalbardensis]
MKKLILALITGFLGPHVFASTLRIPLVLEGDRLIPATEINTKLKALRMPLLPLYYEISDSDNGYQKVKALDAFIAKSLSALGAEYENMGRVWGRVPGSGDVAGFATCYMGNPEGVVNIVSNLADVVYSDQLNVFGYRYKNQKKIYSEDESTEEFLSESSQLWRGWTGQGENLLILSSVGDGGDDVNESLIQRCK